MCVWRGGGGGGLEVGGRGVTTAVKYIDYAQNQL